MGELEPGSVVTMLGFERLDDGTKRARFDAGWMTAEKEGRTYLRRMSGAIPSAFLTAAAEAALFSAPFGSSVIDAGGESVLPHPHPGVRYKSTRSLMSHPNPVWEDP